MKQVFVYAKQVFAYKYAGLLALTLLLITHLASGFTTVSATVYRSPQELMSDFFNGPGRLLVPLVVAIIAEPSTTALIRERFIASTRTRIDIRFFLANFMLRRCMYGGALFFIFGLILAATGYWIAPALFPESIDPEGYALYSEEAVMEDSIQMAPLTGALHISPIWFVTVVALWNALAGVTFTLITILAALFLSNSLLVIVAPFLWYMGTSTALQIANLPALSFTITTPYPYGLIDFQLWAALTPVLVTATASAVFAAVVVWRSRHLSRLS